MVATVAATSIAGSARDRRASTSEGRWSATSLLFPPPSDGNAGDKPPPRGLRRLHSLKSRAAEPHFEVGATRGHAGRLRLPPSGRHAEEQAFRLAARCRQPRLLAARERPWWPLQRAAPADDAKTCDVHLLEDCARATSTWRRSTRALLPDLGEGGDDAGAAGRAGGDALAAGAGGRGARRVDRHRRRARVCQPAGARRAERLARSPADDARTRRAHARPPPRRRRRAVRGGGDRVARRRLKPRQRLPRARRRVRRRPVRARALRRAQFARAIL